MKLGRVKLFVTLADSVTLIERTVGRTQFQVGEQRTVISENIIVPNYFNECMQLVAKNERISVRAVTIVRKPTKECLDMVTGFLSCRVLVFSPGGAKKQDHDTSAHHTQVYGVRYRDFPFHCRVFAFLHCRGRKVEINDRR